MLPNIDTDNYHYQAMVLPTEESVLETYSLSELQEVVNALSERIATLEQGKKP